MARLIGLVILIFTPLSIFSQNKDLLYRVGTTSGVVNENALKPTWANIQNAPVFDYTANRIWFGSGTGQTSSGNLIYNSPNIRLGIGTVPSYTLDMNTTDALRIPVGTSSQRPSMLNGTLRYNTDNDYLEFGRRNTISSLIHEQQILGLFGASKFPVLHTPLTNNLLWRANYRFNVSRHYNSANATANNSHGVFNNSVDDYDACQIPANDSVEFRIALNSKTHVMTYPAGRITVSFYYEPSNGGGLPLGIEVKMKQGATWGNATFYKNINNAYIYEIGEFSYPGDSLNIKIVASNAIGFWLSEISFYPSRHSYYEPAIFVKDNINSLYYNIVGKTYDNSTTFLLNPSGSSYLTNSLGVGQNNPNNRLHVSATANPVRFDGLQANNSATSLLVQTGGVVQTRDVSTLPVPTLNSVLGAGNTTGLDINSTGSISTVNLTASNTVNVGNSNFTLQQVSSEARFQTWGGLPHVWRIGTDEQMRLNGTGLGVKTSTPQYPIDILGDARLTGSLRLGAGSNHSTITRTAGNSVYNTALAGNHIFQSGGTEIAVLDGAGLKLNQTNFLSFRNDASAAISQMTNGDVSYQPVNGALYTRQNGKRKDYQQGVNGRQSIRLRGDLGASTITTTWSDTTKILYYWDTGSLVDVTVTLPSNPQNDVQLRVVSNTFIETFAFQVAGGTSQSIEGTPTSWTGTGANSIWDVQFVSTSEGSQGGKWFITKIR